MQLEDGPECGQNASPRGKQTLRSKAKENPTLVCTDVGLFQTRDAYSMLLDVSRKVTLLRSC